MESFFFLMWWNLEVMELGSYGTWIRSSLSIVIYLLEFSYLLLRSLFIFLKLLIKACLSFLESVWLFCSTIILVFSVLFYVLKEKRWSVRFCEGSGRKTRLKNGSLGPKKNIGLAFLLWYICIYLSLSKNVFWI